MRKGRTAISIVCGQKSLNSRSHQLPADSDHDVQSLIEKIETEGDQDAAAHANNALAFAKVWSAQKGELDEIPDNTEEQNGGDSWAQTLQKIAAEQSRVQVEEKSGRGAKRKAARAKVIHFSLI